MINKNRGGDHKEEREDWLNTSMSELATTRARHDLDQKEAMVTTASRS
jgi:hypothetical protein